MQMKHKKTQITSYRETEIFKSSELLHKSKQNRNISHDDCFIHQKVKSSFLQIQPFKTGAQYLGIEG